MSVWTVHTYFENAWFVCNGITVHLSFLTYSAQADNKVTNQGQREI